MRPRPFAVRRDPIVARANLSTPAGHPHAPEAERRNRRSLGSKFSLVHVIYFPLCKISLNFNHQTRSARKFGSRTSKHALLTVQLDRNESLLRRVLIEGYPHV